MKRTSLGMWFVFIIVILTFQSNSNGVTIYVKKWYDNQNPTTTATTTSASEFTITVNIHVDAVMFWAEPETDSLPLIYINRTDGSAQMIRLYALANEFENLAVPGNTQYPLAAAAANNWGGL